MTSFAELQQSLDDYSRYDISDTVRDDDRTMAAARVAVQVLALLQGASAADIDVEDALLNEVGADSHEEWFVGHPQLDAPMVCELTEPGMPYAATFMALRGSAVKTRISACVSMRDHWEDGLSLPSNLYDIFPVGIHFFAPANTQSIIIAVSKSGNLRTMELRGTLSNTQKRILERLSGLLAADGLTDDDKPRIHAELWDALNVTEVNRSFYQGIAVRFNELVQSIVASGHDADEAKLFASRLIGRILFAWFLDRKGFLNPEERYLETDGLDAAGYYERKLKRLFFATLNTARQDRDEDGDFVTPFLNGGLFEEQTTDFPNETIAFPDDFFTSLYAHFRQYDFTTDESTPDYEQVAIDPEMLGRIFESLLAEQMDDTGKTARNAKGAFYTPRQIVSYMCRESLRQYLYNVLGDGKGVHVGVDRLLDTTDGEWERNGDARRTLWGSNTATVLPLAIQALDGVRVLDPAVGSGAFPMGMLQLLMRCHARLQGRKAVADAYERKMRILQRNIFGVDIEPMAVEVARLRVWLSMIVERGSIDDVEPLPNLDFKFVCADSVVPLAVGEDATDVLPANGAAYDQVLLALNGDDAALMDELGEIRSQYFHVTGAENKSRLMQRFEDIIRQLGHGDMASERSRQLSAFHPHASVSSEAGHAPFFDPDFMFGVNRFDVVIGNPPYVQLQKMADKHKYASLAYKSYNQTGDLYELFYERGLMMLSDRGVLDFITSNKWMRNKYGVELRSYLAANAEVITLIDLGAGRFSSATVDTNIMLLRKGRADGVLQAVRYTGDSLDDIGSYVGEHATVIPFDTEGYDRNTAAAVRGSSPWVILSDVERSIKHRMDEAGTLLKDLDVRINYGVKTGLNDAFIISKEKRDELIAADPKSAEIIRPVLRGRDVKRYRYEFADLYTITLFPSLEYDIDRYPAVKDWLINGDWVLSGRTSSPIGTGRLRLEQTGAEHKCEGVRFKSRKKTGNKWFETQDAISYSDDFSQPKIVWGEISDRAKFAFDGGGDYVPEATTFLMVGSDLLPILGFLNSRLAEYYFSTLGTTTGMGTVRWKKYTIEQLPIALFDGAERETFLQLIRQRLDDGRSEAELQELDHAIDECIASRIGLTRPEMDFIERFSQ
ncbi:Eco57I restriction-modification methylase domain-containing protein [Bifidobacterium samirii]|uniref:site-specific DNA-methyltransferase (adenine-specific) n=1 Tax=Bifidobacterium samirii TaxID=2306974 RepID=A0A430FX65_9BIFI|nr:N-6 DNA methylase [Bifidobacterium samirii]RSX58808.1 TaqI-like C-terminal specificity domain-containing protein [Bifidobacterium samirii]